MKTLENHTLIYDEECPMCDLYTHSFVQLGMLDGSGRRSFAAALTSGLKPTDPVRARDEIALVNRTTGETTYGLDSLLKIVGYRFPLLKPLFETRGFHAIMRRVYSFISFNRKEIIPGKVFEKENACTPTFNLRYRVAFILFAWVASALLLSRYATTFYPIVPPGTFFRELLICGGQIIFQASLVWFLKRERLFHYLGNMMTVSLGGGLLLLIASYPLQAFSAVIHIGYFLFILALMFVEHARRVRHLEISSVVILGWGGYWVLILLLLDLV